MLGREERAGYHDTASNREPVRAHVERLEAATALFLCFPVWNYGYPAILKGWIDRVFLPGVSFTIVDGGVRPALGRIERLCVATTYGGDRLRTVLAGDPPRRIAGRHLRWAGQSPRRLRLPRAVRHEPRGRGRAARPSSNTSPGASANASPGETDAAERARPPRLLPPGAGKTTPRRCAIGVLLALGRAGHETRLLDLHAIGFEAAMSAEERRRYDALGTGRASLARAGRATCAGARESCSSTRPGGTACRPSSRAGSTASGRPARPSASIPRPRRSAR